MYQCIWGPLTASALCPFPPPCSRILALAKVHPMASFNEFVSPELRPVLGLRWPEMLRSGPWTKCQVRSQSQQAQRAHRSLALRALPTQVCSVKAFCRLLALLGQRAGGIFEVKLSINQRGDGRSGTVVRMSWGADTLHF